MATRLHTYVVTGIYVVSATVQATDQSDAYEKGESLVTGGATRDEFSNWHVTQVAAPKRKRKA